MEEIISKATAIVYPDRITGPWPRVEKYVNTTLRYPPPLPLTAELEKRYGQPRVFRCWLTLDEMWDYRTDTWDFNFRIGIHRYDGDPWHYPYDWKVVEPSEIYFEDHLRAISPCCDAMLLNIRRYEREVLDGIITPEQYQTAVERGLRHYKALCPNLRYVEVLNESELTSFGVVGLNDYYRIFYTWINGIVAKLNREEGYDIPLEVGGPTYCHGPDFAYGWRIFLRDYAASPDPHKQLAFFSFHDYHHDFERIRRAREILDGLLAEFDLPHDLPVFMDEYGWLHITPKPYDNLVNAAGLVRNMIRAADLHDFYIFPWCSYHDPVRQLSLTQFITADDGTVKATPCGCAIEALARMKSDRLAVDNALSPAHLVAATRDGDGLAVMALTTCDKGPLDLTVNLPGLAETLGVSGAKVTSYLIDSRHSNSLLVPEWDGSLQRTAQFRASAENLVLEAELEPWAVMLWIVEPG